MINQSYAYNDVSLDTIPLASSSAGYADKILDYKNNGSYVFKFTNGIENNSTKRTDLIIENEYQVIVEPIFWFKPADQSGGYPASPVHPNYVYGTVSNLISFYNSTSDYPGGGAYSPLTHTVGYSCMYTSQSWGDGKIIGFTDTSGRKTTQEILNYINGNYGIAMHLYVTNGSGSSSTQVTGVPEWDKPSPPPDPTKLKTTPKYGKDYNIV